MSAGPLVPMLLAEARKLEDAADYARESGNVRVRLTEDVARQIAATIRSAAYVLDTTELEEVRRSADSVG